MKKTQLRPLQAAIFSIGGPLGWLIIKVLEGSSIVEELQNNWDLYSYMLFGTLMVFMTFASVVGRSEQRNIKLATRDELTGIYNLRYFNEQLEKEVSRARRNQECLSIIFLDLDHFKGVNDRYGHPAGDKVLQGVAASIHGMERSHDTFARVGGEEFAILLPNTALEDAVSNAERIREKIEALPIEIEPQKVIYTTISAGVTSWRMDEAARELYKRADEKLYQAKQLGRNRVVS